MTFADILHKYPQVEDVIMTSGLHCLGCSGAAFESVEVGCKMHGFDNAKIKKLVDEMNRKLKKN
jgi:hybrid cluster-associated redox disulfide protein